MLVRDKIFTMVDNQPHLNPIGINIPEFNELWDNDSSEEKIQYAKELAYIFHMVDYLSPYYDMENKQEIIAKDYLGTSSYKPPTRVKEALDKYKELTFTIERRSLDATIEVLNGLIKDLRQMSNGDQYTDIMNRIDDEIDQTDDNFNKMSFLKEKMEMQKLKADTNKVVIDLADKIKKQVESIHDLRTAVTKAVYKGESTSRIREFIFDKLLAKVRDGRE